MKNFKKVTAVILVLAMSTIFTGCSGDSVGTSKTETLNQTTTTTKAPEKPQVYDNDPVKISGICEFYIESSQITSKVEPFSPSGYYNLYEAESGQTYVDIIVSYKNLSSEEVRPDIAISGASLIYDNSYKYSGFIAIEENNRSDFALFARNTFISPLTTEYIHMIFQVPQEVEDSTDSIKVNFALNDTVYVYKVR